MPSPDRHNVSLTYHLLYHSVPVEDILFSPSPQERCAATDSRL